jgi:hypothetical protein
MKIAKDIVIVDIDPKMWAYAGSKYINAITPSNFLRHHNGAMCCLGFAALELGATKKAITWKGMPYQCGTKVGELFKKVGIDVSIQEDLVAINDENEGLTLKARVLKLNEVCKKKGAKLRFRLKQPVTKKKVA